MQKVLFFFSAALILAGCGRGERGPQGPPGLNGNANIQAVNFTAYPEDWVPFGNANESNFSYTAAYNFPEFTTDIVDYGVVQVYVMSDFGWAALPYTLMEGIYETNLNYAYDYNILTLVVKDSDLQTQPFGKAIDFKVVIAEAGVSKVEIDKAVNGLSELPVMEVSR